MFRKFSMAAAVLTVVAALLFAWPVADPTFAYRVCTFKGTVVDHGWRTMTVKSNSQCAEVNVGWRTKYIPNRRPCLGEQIAVDFVLEDGYMKATKVVSLSPLPASVQCYPPPPPSSTQCRTVGADEVAAPDSCVPSRAICSSKPPAHVSDPSWSPGKKEAVPKPGKPSIKKPEAAGKPGKEAAVKPPDKKEEPKEAPAEDKKYKSMSGEVVASSPKSLSLRVVDEGETAEVISVRVGLKTKFIPFRRPAVGEKVKVEYRQENGDKFGYTVQVLQ